MKKLTKMNLVMNEVLKSASNGENLFRNAEGNVEGLTYLTRPLAYAGKNSSFRVPGLAPLKLGETTDAPSRLKTYIRAMGSDTIGLAFAYDRKHVENQLMAAFKKAGGLTWENTRESFENLDAKHARDIFYCVTENALRFNKVNMEYRLGIKICDRDFREAMTTAWVLKNTQITICTQKMGIVDGIRTAVSNPRNELFAERLSAKGFDFKVSSKNVVLSVDHAKLDQDCAIVFQALESEHRSNSSEFVLTL